MKYEIKYTKAEPKGRPDKVRVKGTTTYEAPTREAAVKAFLDWFFRMFPKNRVRLESVTQIIRTRAPRP